jgi:hypothetical protein
MVKKQKRGHETALVGERDTVCLRFEPNGKHRLSIAHGKGAVPQGRPG